MTFVGFLAAFGAGFGRATISSYFKKNKLQLLGKKMKTETDLNNPEQ
jgi:hypothetical protein